jgi:hypothetical protein
MISYMEIGNSREVNPQRDKEQKMFKLDKSTEKPQIVEAAEGETGVAWHEARKELIEWWQLKRFEANVEVQAARKLTAPAAKVEAAQPEEPKPLDAEADQSEPTEEPKPEVKVEEPKPTKRGKVAA